MKLTVDLKIVNSFLKQIVINKNVYGKDPIIIIIIIITPGNTSYCDSKPSSLTSTY